MTVGLVLVAGGKGLRSGKSAPKQFIALAGKPLWWWALRSLARHAAVTDVVFVVPADCVAQPEIAQRPTDLLRPEQRWTVVAGGAQRQDSVRAGVQALGTDVDIVLVHDAARPFPPESLEPLLAALGHHAAAVYALPVVDSLRRSQPDGTLLAPVDRSNLWAMQTPQATSRELLLRALAVAAEAGTIVTDEAEALMGIGASVAVVTGTATNRKITHPEDWAWAEDQMQQRGVANNVRVGIGFDVHRFVAGRPLILGGIHVESALGLDGHSDADVLLHALTDAILSGLGLGDIGSYFPNTDPQWKGADSRVFVEEAVRQASARGYAVGNVSATIHAEAPKLRPYIEAICGNVAAMLGVDRQSVGVAAGTLEKMGFIGRQEGMAAQVAVTLIPRAMDGQ